MYNFKIDEVVILLGAGASVEAGIPHSADMIKNLEGLIEKKLVNYQRLYNYIKSSIKHSSGIQGRFDIDNYNIETLVNNLDELIKKHEHILYPFVGAWNPTLVELAGSDFLQIKNLKEKILDELRTKWLAISDEEVASYYGGLLEFRRDLELPLRIFSLNYDMCLELICQKKNVNLVSGFGKDKIWNWRQFDSTNEDPDIYHYKLHGSVNWTYENDKLTYDAPGKIAHEDAALIFGTSYKLQYRDPFLFLIYEFRKWVLESKLIVCIGYGFGDEHINKIIQQALVQDKNRLLLAVAPFEIKNKSETEKFRKEQAAKVSKLLDLKNGNQIVDQIICREYKAKKFMLDYLNRNYLAELFIPEKELFPTLD